MSVNTIGAETLKVMFLAGAKNLEVKKEWINELNVFPVPDGDTGTNMTLTILAAVNEVNNLKTVNMKTISKAISSGSLRGARGNSGVILSQLLRGFTKSIKDKKELDAPAIAEAFDKAVQTAYKAVMKPKEGTILTVARAAAEKATQAAGNTKDLQVLFEEILEEAEAVLKKTPDMLPVLKEAGVVDSGGQGLVEVLRGAYNVFMGKEVDLTFTAPSSPVKSMQAAETPLEDIKFGYCTEFIILTEKTFTEAQEIEFKEFLSSIGDSIVCVADEDLVKVHVHTNDPGLAIQRALTYGELSRMKIDNMREEHREKVIMDAQRLADKQAKEDLERQKAAKKAEPRKAVGFISVSVGDGIGSIFKSLNVDYLIEGGQTMNPSTEDMLNAIDEVNADTIFILPNNKNIILAANQARDLTEDKKIIVVPTRTVPQGISAVISYLADRSPEENQEAMEAAISQVKTGQITYAVRDTHIDDKEIHEGDIMAIGDKGLLFVGNEVMQVTKDTVGELVDDETELISVYYGQDVSKEAAMQLADELQETYEDCDVEVNYGGQPIYYCIVSVE